MGKGNSLKETVEVIQPPDQPFGLDLLLPIAVPDMPSTEEMLAHIPKDFTDFVERIKKEAGFPGGPVSRFDFLSVGVGGTHETQRKQMDAILEAKPHLFAGGLGMPAEFVPECHEAGIKVCSLIGNVKQARRVADIGVDVIVSQGHEAGGHTGRIGTMVLTPQVVDAVSPIPVLAAGGIADGRGLVASLSLGAQGVWTGSIWLAAKESDLEDFVKEKIIEATEEDAVICKAYTGKTARWLRNKWVDVWKQPGAPSTLPMPFQSLNLPVPIYASVHDPGRPFAKPGLQDWATTPAGQVVGAVHKQKPAKQIVSDMLSQANMIMDQMSA